MGRRGPKPQPSALLRLTGSRRVADRAGEPQPPVKLPPCPRDLSKAARAEWRRVGRELLNLGLVTPLDRTALALVCELWARWCECQDKIKEHGLVIKSPSGFPQANPYISIGNKCIEQLSKLLPEFGLTPSSRTRLRTPTPESKPGDPFSDLGQFVAARKTGA